MRAALLNGDRDWPIDVVMDLLDIRGLESIGRLIDNNLRLYRIFAKLLGVEGRRTERREK